MLVALLVAPASVGAHPANGPRRLTVASYNLYLGANLRPLFAAPPGPGLVEVAAAVYRQVNETDFPARAEILAREIAEDAPDIVGLQEVARWETAPATDPSASEVAYDFLDTLVADLESRGVAYRPVSTSVNFAGALPISATTIARFTDRDVVLARADRPRSPVKVSNPMSGHFDAVLAVTVGGQAVEIPRGWSSIDVKERGRSLRFITRHLEAFSAPIRQRQAQELVAIMAASPLPVVLAGDLNTRRGDQSDAYGVFTAAGLVDAWPEAMAAAPGYTAGQAADVPHLPSALDHTVDYVMHTSQGCLAAVAGEGDILGEDLQDRTPSGPWPSDHAGVVVTLQIPSCCRQGFGRIR